MADNDQFRLRVGGTATNAGYVELATADDGTEPIYVRQYTGVFSVIARTATLLDGSGNTSFPGTVSGTSFNSITGLSSTTPIVDGTAAIGTGTTAARADHVHPTDTSRAATSGTLAQFAATTSSQLAGVVSDETGSGSLVFATSPTLTTPRLAATTTTATAGLRDFDGTVFYSTTTTTPGKALDVASYYYLSSATYVIDTTSGAVAQSLLGGAAIGIQVAAGTTYDYEGMFAISATYILTAQTPTLEFTATTISGSPTVSHQTIYETGSNTTSLATATTLTATRSTTTQALTALTTGSRYYIIKMRGRIAVTGTGVAEIYPSFRVSTGSVDNAWIVQSGAMYKLTPIGNGTATTVGTWS
jgi:hypothetical protein